MASDKVFDFLVIGGQRCGSTWVHYLLDQHPDIFVPQVKEVHFFNHLPNYEQGVDWYRKYLSPTKGERLVGECTPNYFWNHLLPGEISSERHITDIAPKVRAMNPDARLILVLRDPVARAISGYHHQIVMGRIKPRDGFRKSLLKYGIQSIGVYSENLKHWLASFDRENFLILNFERDVLGDKDATVARIFDFLGAENVDGLQYDEPRNARGSYFSMQLSNYIPSRSLVGKAARKVSGKLLSKEFDQRFKPSPTEDDLVYLREFYAPYNRELDRLIGEDFSSYWQMPA